MTVSFVFVGGKLDLSCVFFLIEVSAMVSLFKFQNKLVPSV